MKIKKIIFSNKKYIFLGLIALLIIFTPIPIAHAKTKKVTISVQASSFSFSPGIVKVNQGDLVVIELTSQDVVHGLHLETYDLSVTSDPGQMRSISFVADKQGTFRFRCSVTCGALHPFMAGKLKVGTNQLVWRGTAMALLLGFFGIWSVRNE